MFYGIKYPENLNSIVLIDSDAASWELRTPHQIQTIRSRLSESDWQTMDSLERSGAFVNKDPEMIEYYFRIFLKSYFADPADITKLELGFDKQLVEKNVITSKFIRDNLGVYDVHEKLSAITCPVLIMIGRQSVFSVEGAKAIDDALPNSRLIIFENCGHFEYIEQPEQFEKAIKSFYGSINS
jgi:proline iminopeptidase